MVVLNLESEWVMKNIKLIEARNKTGLTQVQVAEKAKITPICYQRYESGERIPKADVANRIEDALRVKSYRDLKDLFS